MSDAANRTPAGNAAGELVLVLHGPGLSALGRREPAIYGTTTLAEIDRAVAAEAHRLGARATFTQSNHEGALIDAILAAPDLGVSGILINPGAYTHTSLAIADALRAAGLPAVEVHLSQIWAREAIRRRSLVGRACAASVSGFGAGGYVLALRGLLAMLRGDVLPGGDTR